MRTTVIIQKRGEGYIATVSGQFGGGYTGRRAGLSPFDAAAAAAQAMIEYGTPNQEGATLMAPPEVMEYVPEHLRNMNAAT